MTYTEIVRLAELEMALTELKLEKLTGNTILEIGAGAGWQAKRLSESGYAVAAIDIKDSIYSDSQVWPILMYDGTHIPFPDNHFDLIFSSNVLEHIGNLDRFQTEMKRVLKPSGVAIHIVPSASWRIWTNSTHYLFQVKALMKICYERIMNVSRHDNLNEMEKFAYEQIASVSITNLFKMAVFPPRHGAKGNALAEIYLYRRSRWRCGFERANWRIEKITPNRLFYTGYMILGPVISINVRRKLSYFLGSSCHIFKLRNT